MKQVITICIIFVFSLSTGWGQQKGPHISFEKDVHDFGNINESKGKVMCNFHFVNTGSAPLIINDVKATCGCTAPEWSKKPILPGQKGFVKATFDPKNRPGHFSKTIYVKSNSIENSQKVLTIKGNVNPKEKTLADEYPHKIGDIRLRTNHLAFGTVLHNKQKEKSFEFVNISEQPVTLSFKNTPSHVTLNVHPATLSPNEKGVIKAKYDATKINDWGFVVHKLNILINNEEIHNHRLTISANIKEDFSHLSTEELKNTPVISFKEKTFDFQSAPQHTNIKHKFKITNTGKSNLVIRKIKSSCGCTVAQLEDKTLSPGESKFIEITFRTGKRKGFQKKLVTIISNDPKHDVERLYIKGTVTPEQ